MTSAPGRFPPWSSTPSLLEMTNELGISMDELIAEIENNSSIAAMAEKFNISQYTIEQLQEHFFRYGVGSVNGGD